MRSLNARNVLNPALFLCLNHAINNILRLLNRTTLLLKNRADSVFSIPRTKPVAKASIKMI